MSEAVLPAALAPHPPRPQRPTAFRRFLHDPISAASIGLVGVLLLAAAVAPWLAPYPYDAVAPAEQWQGPSLVHLMGTDQFGRDVLSRVLWGAQVSLIVGLLTVALAMTIGVSVGLAAGYRGGLADELIMRVVDVLLSVPGVVLALATVAAIGPSLPHLVIALSLYRVAQFARVARGAALGVMAQDYIASCRAVGMGHLRIALRHVLPNCSGPLIVLATVMIGNVILTESTLSFLGMGVQPPVPSWGGMIADGNEYLMFAPWLSLFPGSFLLLTVLGFNLAGDGLQDVLDPRGPAPQDNARA